jgi:phosphoribosylanthranilate isomerase
MRTRIKMCGMTREHDIECAVQAGVDAIGLIFYSASKRCVTPARAAQLRRCMPAFVDVVALFINPDPGEVLHVLDVVGPDLLQFHGDETVDDCERYGERFIRAFRVGAPGLDTAEGLAAACRPYNAAAAWLFDSYSPGYGGSGSAFAYDLLQGVQAERAARSVVLAGGLTAESVAQAIVTVRPWAVDVSSGVEQAPGIKCEAKIRAFVDAVKIADNVCLAKK